MISRCLALAGCVAACLSAFSVGRSEEGLEVQCEKSRFFAAPADSSLHRKYAPDREMDLLNLALDVTPDFENGRTPRKRFSPSSRLPSLCRSCGWTRSICRWNPSLPPSAAGYQVTDKQLIVTFAEPIPFGKEASVTIRYSAEPSRGLYFRTPEMGYKAGDTHLFTQGEAIEARHWYPCFDAPNEKFTSEITCRVPEGMLVLSNGKLLSETRDAARGLTVVHWRQDKPHANYLISLVAGYFKKVEGQAGDIPMAFYTPSSEIEQAASSFRDTQDAMSFFQEQIGVPYPWAK